MIDRTLLVSALALLTWGAPAHGATLNELWPELNLFQGLDTRSRIVLIAAATHDRQAAPEGRAPSFEDAQFSVNFDYTLAPRIRTDVPETEWSKNRYLWARIGYQYGTNFGFGDAAFRSRMGLAALNARFPLGGEIWLNNRLRVDLRDADGQTSQRYRVRTGLDVTSTVVGYPSTLWVDAEAMYDTRFDTLNRALFRAGVELALDSAWRLEPYLALQVDRLRTETARVAALGLTLKYYR